MLFGHHSFNLQANVVCRQLGFPHGAISANCCSVFGNVHAQMVYDLVNCNGNEETLNSCMHLNTPLCDSTHAAGVSCNKTDYVGN